MNSAGSRREDRLGTLGIPLRDIHAVHRALVLLGDGFPDPRARLVRQKRRLTWGDSREWRVDERSDAVAFEVGPAQHMRGGNPVDFCDLPGLPGIEAMLQHGKDTQAVLWIGG